MKPELFIDVRTESEWNTGHIEGALHFDLALLQQGKLSNLEKYTPIALYCRSGGRAEIASTILRQQGFSNAGSFTGLQNIAA